jgi:hypothetical protein
MNGSLKARVYSVGIALGLIVGLFGAVTLASAHPARQGSDPISVVNAMSEAFNNQDVAKLKDLLDPSFLDTVENAPPGAPPDFFAPNNRDAFIAASQAGIRVTQGTCKLTAPDTVVCDTSLAGGPLPPLPHGFNEVSTATVVNGKVTRLSEKLSDQTYQELAALLAGGQPGMPTTGSADTTLPLFVLTLGLLSLAAGFLARRAQMSRG